MKLSYRVKYQSATGKVIWRTVSGANLHIINAMAEVYRRKNWSIASMEAING